MPTRTAPSRLVPVRSTVNLTLARGLVWVVVALLAFNQYLIAELLPKEARAGVLSIAGILGARSAAAQTIIAPRINPDGKTTSLVEQPTISAVPANPNSGDAVADATVVMLGTGSPDYAPDGISFSDPVAAQNAWGRYETSIQLTGTLLERYNQLTDLLPCSYCCGSAMDVTHNRNCGCAHAKAARGYFRYMLQTFGDRYTDAQLLGEAFRWQAIWYPKGAVEDYLLATGKGSVLGHAPHGGVGADGMHGLTKE